MKNVVIVGGGFGGLYCARALADAQVRVTLVDRRNHHLFQPLLYQVATAALNPSDIAQPIRAILRKQPNCEVLLAEVASVDAAGKRVILDDGSALPFDYLVLATGATHSYFGHDEWADGGTGPQDRRGRDRNSQAHLCRRSKRPSAWPTTPRCSASG